MSLLTKKQLEEIRIKVFERDRRKCLISECNDPRYPDVHHILGNPRRKDTHNELRNLISLCRNHHQKIHNSVESIDIVINFLRNILKLKYHYTYDDYWERSIRKRNSEILLRDFESS